MYDDDDPFLVRLDEIARALPDADMKVSHGRPAFFTTKVFAYYGGSVKVDGEWVQHSRCIIVLVDPGERQALLSEPRGFVPAYLGPAGWVGVDLVPDETGTVTDVDWAEVAELLDASYRLTAGPRRVAALDSRG